MYLGRCVSCKFYTEEENYRHHPGYGECRRFPPQIYKGEDMVYHRFPIVKPTFWCGEYHQKGMPK